MEKKFNNYTLSNEEISTILQRYSAVIKKAARINGKFDEDCEQKIKIAIFRKLSRHRK